MTYDFRPFKCPRIRKRNVILPMLHRLALIVALIWLALTALETHVDAQEMKIPPQFDEAGHFHEGMAPVRVGSTWGFVDRTGKWIVKPLFQSVMAGSDGRFAIKQNGLWGFIDTNGRIAIAPKYIEVRRFSDGVAAFREGDRWGYIGPTGIVDHAATYTFAGQRSQGQEFVSDEEMGFAVSNSLGQWSSLGRGTAASDFSEGMASIKDPKTNKWSLFGSSSSGQDVTFAAVGDFSEGLARATQDGTHWGFVTKTAQFAIPPTFLKARDFSNNVAPVEIAGKWGYIDRVGRLVDTPRYDSAYPFQEGFALFRMGTHRGYLAFDGFRITIAIPAQFDDAFAFKEGFAPVKIDDKWGFLGADTRQKPNSMVRDIVDLDAQN